MPRFRLFFCYLSRFSAILLINEKFCAAFPALFLLWSSLKATSNTQWNEFSTSQCERTDLFIKSASASRLLYTVRSLSASFAGICRNAPSIAQILPFRPVLYQGQIADNRTAPRLNPSMTAIGIF